MSGRGRGARGAKFANPKRSLENLKSENIVEVEEDEVPAKKANRGGGVTGGGKKVKGKLEMGEKGREEEDDAIGEDTEEDIEDEEEEDEDEEDEEEEEEEEEECGSEASEESNPDQPPRKFGPRSFVVLKSEFEDEGIDPPLWRIDGNSLLQKFTPFKDKDGKVLYKSTTVYSGWSIKNKESYYHAPVLFQKEEKNDSIVSFQRNLVNKEEVTENK